MYRISETFTLGEEDSGTQQSPVIWQASPGESVRLVGGVKLTDWQPVSDAAVRERLAPEARPHVRQTDLRSAGVRDFGEVRPGNRRAELFVDNRYMQLARYPNEGFLRIADVPQQGELKFRGMYRGPNPVLHGGMPWGRHYGRFVYDDDRPSRWKPTDDLWLCGYWTVDYREEYFHIAKLDTAAKEVWPVEQGAYGYSKDGRYYFLNVLEELEEPGEWYLDRQKGMLYLWFPEGTDTEEAWFAEMQNPLVELAGCRHIHLRGLTLECSRGCAVVINGGELNEVAGCTLRNVGNTAVSIEGGKQNGVRSCDFYETGAGGVSLSGGDRKTLSPGGHVVDNCHFHHYARVFRTYRPAVQLAGVGHRVSHCSIHDAPHAAIGYGGNDHVIEFCEFTRTGLETGDVGVIYSAMDWTYMGQVFRYNYFHHIHPPPRVHVGAMTLYMDLPVGGSHIYGNVFDDCERAVFYDSGRGVVVENNVFVRCQPAVEVIVWTDAQYFKPGGPWRMVERLAEVDYDKSPYSTRYPVLQGLAADFAKGEQEVRQRQLPKDNVVRRNVSFDGHFVKLHPWVRRDHVRIEKNLVADEVVFTGSLDGDGKSSQYRNGDKAVAEAFSKAGNVIREGNPGFVDVEAEDFRLAADSPAWGLGFEPIPLEQIGLRIDEYRKTLPPRAPAIRPGSRLFVGKLDVEVVPSSRGGDAVLRYTLDGTDPTPASPRYTGPVALEATTVLKAASFAGTGAEAERSAVVSAAFTAGRLGNGSAVYLSQLPGLEVFAHGGLKLDVNYSGGAIQLAGRSYERGVMICPEATGPGGTGGKGSVTYMLDGGLNQASRFRAVVGIEDAMKVHKNGSATFAVDLYRQGEWQTAFESRLLRIGQTQQIDVPIAGADRLRLRTTDGGDTIHCDHAVWADARLE